MIYRTHSVYKTLKIYFWSELTFTSNVIYNTTIVEPFAYVIHNTLAIVDTGVMGLLYTSLQEVKICFH